MLHTTRLRTSHHSHLSASRAQHRRRATRRAVGSQHQPARTRRRHGRASGLDRARGHQPRSKRYDLQTKFVAAVSGRGAVVRPLSLDNQLLGVAVDWCREASQGPYVVALANPNGRFVTVALDFDAKLGEVGDAADDADAVMALLQSAGFPAVLVRSGPTDGRHIITTVGGPGLDVPSGRELVRRFVALGFRTLDPTCMGSNQAAIRPPYADHRLGGYSSVVGKHPDDALELLRRDRPDTPTPGDWRRFIDALGRPDAVRQRLHSPAAVSGVADAATTTSGTIGRSGSDRLQQHATKVVNAGGGVAELRDLLQALEPTDPALQHLDKKSARAREQAVVRSVEAAKRFVAENPAVHQGIDDAMVIAEWRSADLGSLPGPGGSVVQVMRTLAERNQSRLVGVSLRDGALRAGISRSGFARGLAWAVEVGMLAVAGESRGAKAVRYRLQPFKNWSAAVRGAVGTSMEKGGVSKPTVSGTAATSILADDRAAEVWMDGGLGNRRRLVYRALDQLAVGVDSVSTAAVAAELGKSERQTRDDLSCLASHGLAHDLGRAGWMVEYRDADELADELGVKGLADRRRQQYRREQRDHLLKNIHYRLRQKFPDAASVAHLGAGPRRRPQNALAGGAGLRRSSVDTSRRRGRSTRQSRPRISDPHLPRRAGRALPRRG